MEERLNESARKAKRNLLFFALVAIAIWFDWIEPTAEGRVFIGGIGATTTLQFICALLAGLLGFNLFSLWFHSPDHAWAWDPLFLWALYPSPKVPESTRAVYQWIEQTCGKAAIQAHWPDREEFEHWIEEQLPEATNWNEAEDPDRRVALAVLWRSLHWRVKMKLRWKAVWYPPSRAQTLGAFFDFWLPIVAGVLGLLAAGIRWFTLTFPAFSISLPPGF